MKTTPVLFFLLLFLGTCLHAQDIHFSQFYRQQLNLNPALTGVFRGDYRAAAIYRGQWASIPVPYQTFSANLDMKLPVKIAKNTMLSAGFVMNVDEAGDSDMQQLEVGAVGSISYWLSDQFAASIGVGATLWNRSFDFAGLSFDEQFDGEIYDPSNPNNENSLATNQTDLRIGTGLNLHFRSKKTRTYVDLGGALHNVNQPDGAFSNSRIGISSRLGAYLKGAIEILPVFDVFIGGLYQNQGPYQEILAGGTLRYFLNPKKGSELMLGLGTFFRPGDAFIPVLEVQYQNLQAGLSYDVNTSELRAATNRRGGPEISLTYILARVQPPPVFKACPTF